MATVWILFENGHLLDVFANKNALVNGMRAELTACASPEDVQIVVGFASVEGFCSLLDDGNIRRITGRERIVKT